MSSIAYPQLSICLWRNTIKPLWRGTLYEIDNNVASKILRHYYILIQMIILTTAPLAQGQPFDKILIIQLISESHKTSNA